MTTTEVLAGIRQRGGFLTEGDLEVLRRDERARLWPILVRCGGGRFTCPAQDVNHFVGIIRESNEERGDYVRDVSLVAGYGYGS